jgi:glycosyltransferase involved in cell wall biosynthesis
MELLDSRNPPPKLLFLITEDWFAASHFLPMLRKAKAMGLDVVVVARVRSHRSELEAEGVRVVALEAERSSLDPFQIRKNIYAIERIIRDEAPDIVHCVALRVVTLGGLAAKLAGVRNVVLAPVGLGHTWIIDGTTHKLIRTVLRHIIGRTLRRDGTVYLFENDEDPAEFGLDTGSQNVRIIGGAGVDPLAFPPTPEPECPPIRVAVVARMLRDKGIRESIEAVRLARGRGAPVELDLYGDVDLSNRSVISDHELRELCSGEGVTWQGHTTDVASVWKSHHIAMLLSHREGLPRCLIEAAASRRAIIATDVIGCRSVVHHGREGLLVPLGDVNAAADALVRLSTDHLLRQRLADAAYTTFLSRFTEQAVTRTISKVYQGMLDGHVSD